MAFKLNPITTYLIDRAIVNFGHADPELAQTMLSTMRFIASDTYPMTADEASILVDCANHLTRKGVVKNTKSLEGL